MKYLVSVRGEATIIQSYEIEADTEEQARDLAATGEVEYVEGADEIDVQRLDWDKAMVSAFDEYTAVQMPLPEKPNNGAIDQELFQDAVISAVSVACREGLIPKGEVSPDEYTKNYAAIGKIVETVLRVAGIEVKP